MKAGEKVSIIEPCYNQGQYLRQALDSVIAQTYSNWEAIVINDGSTDNTDVVAKKYLEKDSRIRYLKQGNMGVSIARNNAIKSSEGYYILPLDADDIIDPTYIEKAVSVFQKEPSIKIVYSKAIYFGGKTGEYYVEQYEYDNFIWKNCIFNTAMYKKSDYISAGGYK